MKTLPSISASSIGSVRARPKLADVARRAGVGVVTASRALSGTGPVAVQTRNRILKAARSLGYRMNLSAASTASGRFNCVALVTSADGVAFVPPSMLLGMESALDGHGMHMVLSHMREKALTDRTFMPRVLEHLAADGLIISYLTPQRAVFRELIDDLRLPTVYVNSWKEETDCALLDDVGGGRAATEHLLALGHRRIAYANLCGWGHYSELDRRDGYVQAMQAAGLSPQVMECMPPADNTGVYDKSPARDLLARAERPTAVVVYTAHMAQAFLLAAAQLGLAVPQDLSIISFGESGDQNAGETLTLMNTHPSELGALAVQLLLQRIAAGQPLPSAYRQLTLLPGKSTAPPQMQTKP